MQWSWADCLFTNVVALSAFHPFESVNEDQLRLETQRQVQFILFADKCVGVQVKL